MPPAELRAQGPIEVELSAERSGRTVTTSQVINGRGMSRSSADGRLRSISGEGEACAGTGRNGGKSMVNDASTKVTDASKRPMRVRGQRREHPPHTGGKHLQAIGDVLGGP
jgi:hypothetical protein